MARNWWWGETIPDDLVDNIQGELANTCASELLDDPILRTPIGDRRSPVGDLCGRIGGLALVTIHLRCTGWGCGEVVGGGHAMAVSSLTMRGVKNSCHLSHIEKEIFSCLVFFLLP